jgi:tRNA 2-thiouridine synthesizing protein E
MTTTERARAHARQEVDEHGYLVRPSEWDEAYVKKHAAAVGIVTELTDDHWRVIRFIRNAFEQLGKVPLVYVTCVNNRLRLGDLRRLFPAGYHRGACRLAGVSYRTGYYSQWVDREQLVPAPRSAKVYRIDGLGFLVDPGDWDEGYALNKASELKMPEGLTEAHWKVIRYLRDAYARTRELPNVYAACEDNGLEIEDLQRLFPDGYHRGAVKLAGLRYP